MDQKVIFITGVSTGLGFYMARWAAEAGFTVFGTVREVKGAIPPHPDVRLVEMDLLQSDSVRNAFDELQHKFGVKSLYALVNNAGIAVAGPLAYLDEHRFTEQLQVNCIGPFLCIKRAFPLLLQCVPGSRIINVGSVSGLFASPFLGAYCASKFALEGMSDSLRREAALLGIQVAILEPASIRTPIWEKSKGSLNQFQNTPFKPYLQHADDIIAAAHNASMDPDVLKKPFLHSLQAREVSARYLIHRKPFLVRLLLTFVPDAWLDRLAIRKVSGTQQKFRPI